MKTFINVLYRRILYKIPLKLLLVLLAVFGVLFACFSSATTINNADTVVFGFLNDYAYQNLNLKERFGVNGDMVFCAFFQNAGTFNDGVSTYNLSSYQTYCSNNSTIIINPNGQYWATYFNKVGVDIFYPPYSSLQCQTEYNLIPISSVDQNYCTTNNLCPSQECPDIPAFSGDLSELYINNILHVGAPTILMNISDEIDWDYAYTMGGNVMNIDIVGYNVDYQAVEDEINIQKYKPTGEELSLIVSNIIPLFVPGLCIILLLYFIFKFIKKVF